MKTRLTSIFLITMLLITSYTIIAYSEGNAVKAEYNSYLKMIFFEEEVSGDFTITIADSKDETKIYASKSEEIIGDSYRIADLVASVAEKTAVHIWVLDENSNNIKATTGNGVPLNGYVFSPSNVQLRLEDNMLRISWDKDYTSNAEYHLEYAGVSSSTIQDYFIFEYEEGENQVSLYTEYNGQMSDTVIAELAAAPKTYEVSVSGELFSGANIYVGGKKAELEGESFVVNGLSSGKHSIELFDSENIEYTISPNEIDLSDNAEIEIEILNVGLDIEGNIGLKTDGNLVKLNFNDNIYADSYNVSLGEFSFSIEDSSVWHSLPRLTPKNDMELTITPVRNGYTGTSSKEEVDVVGRLYGKITHKDGTPALNITLRLGEKTATTNQNGEYEIEALEGETKLVVEYEWKSEEHSLIIDSLEKEFNITPTAYTIALTFDKKVSEVFIYDDSLNLVQQAKIDDYKFISSYLASGSYIVAAKNDDNTSSVKLTATILDSDTYLSANLSKGSLLTFAKDGDYSFYNADGDVLDGDISSNGSYCVVKLGDIPYIVTGTNQEGVYLSLISDFMLEDREFISGDIVLTDSLTEFNSYLLEDGEGSIYHFNNSTQMFIANNGRIQLLGEDMLGLADIQDGNVNNLFTSDIGIVTGEILGEADYLSVYNANGELVDTYDIISNDFIIECSEGMVLVVYDEESVAVVKPEFNRGFSLDNSILLEEGELYILPIQSEVTASYFNGEEFISAKSINLNNSTSFVIAPEDATIMLENNGEIAVIEYEDGLAYDVYGEELNLNNINYQDCSLVMFKIENFNEIIDKQIEVSFNDEEIILFGEEFFMLVPRGEEIELIFKSDSRWAIYEISDNEDSFIGVIPLEMQAGNVYHNEIALPEYIEEVTVYLYDEALNMIAEKQTKGDFIFTGLESEVSYVAFSNGEHSAILSEKTEFFKASLKEVEVTNYESPISVTGDNSHIISENRALVVAESIFKISDSGRSFIVNNEEEVALQKGDSIAIDKSIISEDSAIEVRDDFGMKEITDRIDYSLREDEEYVYIENLPISAGSFTIFIKNDNKVAVSSKFPSSGDFIIDKLVFSEGNFLCGRTIDHNNTAISEAVITAYNDEDEVIGRAVSNKAGYYEFVVSEKPHYILANNNNDTAIITNISYDDNLKYYYAQTAQIKPEHNNYLIKNLARYNYYIFDTEYEALSYRYFEDDIIVTAYSSSKAIIMNYQDKTGVAFLEDTHLISSPSLKDGKAYISLNNPVNAKANIDDKSYIADENGNIAFISEKDELLVMGSFEGKSSVSKVTATEMPFSMFDMELKEGEITTIITALEGVIKIDGDYASVVDNGAYYFILRQGEHLISLTTNAGGYVDKLVSGDKLTITSEMLSSNIATGEVAGYTEDMMISLVGDGDLVSVGGSFAARDVGESIAILSGNTHSAVIELKAGSDNIINPVEGELAFGNVSYISNAPAKVYAVGKNGITNGLLFQNNSYYLAGVSEDTEVFIEKSGYIATGKAGEDLSFSKGYLSVGKLSDNAEISFYDESLELIDIAVTNENKVYSIVTEKRAEYALIKTQTGSYFHNLSSLSIQDINILEGNSIVILTKPNSYFNIAGKEYYSNTGVFILNSLLEEEYLVEIRNGKETANTIIPTGEIVEFDKFGDSSTIMQLAPYAKNAEVYIIPKHDFSIAPTQITTTDNYGNFDVSESVYNDNIILITTNEGRSYLFNPYIELENGFVTAKSSIKADEYYLNGKLTVADTKGNVLCDGKAVVGINKEGSFVGKYNGESLIFNKIEGEIVYLENAGDSLKAKSYLIETDEEIAVNIVDNSLVYANTPKPYLLFLYNDKGASIINSSELETISTAEIEEGKIAVLGRYYENNDIYFNGKLSKNNGSLYYSLIDDTEELVVTSSSSRVAEYEIDNSFVNIGEIAFSPIAKGEIQLIYEHGMPIINAELNFKLGEIIVATEMTGYDGVAKKPESFDSVEIKLNDLVIVRKLSSVDEKITLNSNGFFANIIYENRNSIEDEEINIGDYQFSIINGELLIPFLPYGEYKINIAGAEIKVISSDDGIDVFGGSIEKEGQIITILKSDSIKAVEEMYEEGRDIWEMLSSLSKLTKHEMLGIEDSVLDEISKMLSGEVSLKQLSNNSSLIGSNDIIKLFPKELLLDLDNSSTVDIIWNTVDEQSAFEGYEVIDSFKIVPTIMHTKLLDTGDVEKQEYYILDSGAKIQFVLEEDELLFECVAKTGRYTISEGIANLNADTIFAIVKVSENEGEYPELPPVLFEKTIVNNYFYYTPLENEFELHIEKLSMLEPYSSYSFEVRPSQKIPSELLAFMGEPSYITLKINGISFAPDFYSKLDPQTSYSLTELIKLRGADIEIVSYNYTQTKVDTETEASSINDEIEDLENHEADIEENSSPKSFFDGGIFQNPIMRSVYALVFDSVSTAKYNYWTYTA